MKEKEDDGAEELLMDSLIGEACGDEDILEELMTVQEVFDSVQEIIIISKATIRPSNFLRLVSSQAIYCSNVEERRASFG